MLDANQAQSRCLPLPHLSRSAASSRHTQRSKFSAGLIGKESVHSVDHAVLQEFRFHREPRTRARSASVERDRSLLAGFAAGEPSSSRSRASFASNPGEVTAGSHTTIRRFDTPGGLTERMGRLRSTTPDYHRRYASNMAGVFGGTDQELDNPRVMPSPRGVRAVAIAPTDVRMAQKAAPWERQGEGLSQCPGSTRPTKGSIKPQAFSFSSSKPVA